MNCGKLLPLLNQANVVAHKSIELRERERKREREREREKERERKREREREKEKGRVRYSLRVSHSIVSAQFLVSGLFSMLCGKPRLAFRNRKE